jgi:hypothetical protein
MQWGFNTYNTPEELEILKQKYSKYPEFKLDQVIINDKIRNCVTFQFLPITEEKS